MINMEEVYFLLLHLQYHAFTGGKKFSTTVDTLTQREPDSMLAAMFSGRHTVCQDAEKVVSSGVLEIHILMPAA